MGLLKRIFQIKTYLITFAAGALVYRCASADERYRVTRMEHEAYLVDKQTKMKLPIDEDSFQVGTLEYRVEGILTEPELAAMFYRLREKNNGGKKQ